MNVEQCYEWLRLRRERAIEPDQEKMVQRLVDAGRAVWFGRRRRGSAYLTPKSLRWARALPAKPWGVKP
jgi:hypothetical protein